MVRRKLFLRWSLLVILMVIGSAIVQRLGWFQLMYDSDFTKLTVMTLLLFAGGTFWCGTLIWRLENAAESLHNKALSRAGLLSDIEVSAGHGWLSAGICQGLGLLGTVWGIYAVFAGGFVGFAGGDANAIQTLLERLSSGMATATITTIVGLICSMLLHIQYHMLGSAIDRMKTP